jgi:hypothetical protein
MKPNIQFDYVANQKPKQSYNHFKGLILALLTGLCVTMILIFALVPGAGEMFDNHANYMVAMNTMYLIIAVSASLIGLIWAFKKK